MAKANTNTATERPKNPAQKRKVYRQVRGRGGGERERNRQRDRERGMGQLQNGQNGQNETRRPAETEIYFLPRSLMTRILIARTQKHNRETVSVSHCDPPPPSLPFLGLPVSNPLSPSQLISSNKTPHGNPRRSRKVPPQGAQSITSHNSSRQNAIKVIVCPTTQQQRYRVADSLGYHRQASVCFGEISNQVAFKGGVLCRGYQLNQYRN